MHRVAERDQRSLKMTYRLQLNLLERPDGLLECRGRIQGDYPIYLPDTQPYTEKLVLMSRLVTLHGGVVLMMTKVREGHWVPRLRRLAKKDNKELFWLQTIPGYCADKAFSWKFTKRSNRRNISISSSGCRFRLTFEISEEKKERRQGLHYTLRCAA